MSALPTALPIFGYMNILGQIVWNISGFDCLILRTQKIDARIF